MVFQVIGIGLGIIFLGASSYFLWGGLRHRGYGRTLARANPIDAETPGPGDLTVIDGNVGGPADGTPLESGYSGTACVAYATRNIKQKAHANEDIRRANNYRERIREDSAAIPFMLEAGGRSLRVEAEDAHVEVDDDEYEPVSLGDVRQNRGMLVGLWWLARAVLTSTDRQRRREYLEARFGAGDPVRVIGAYDATGSDSETITPPAEAPLVVTSKSHDGVVDRFTSSAKQRLLSGVVLLIIGVVIFLFVLGII